MRRQHGYCTLKDGWLSQTDFAFEQVLVRFSILFWLLPLLTSQQQRSPLLLLFRIIQHNTRIAQLIRVIFVNKNISLQQRVYKPLIIVAYRPVFLKRIQLFK